MNSPEGMNRCGVQAAGLLSAGLCVVVTERMELISIIMSARELASSLSAPPVPPPLWATNSVTRFRSSTVTDTWIARHVIVLALPANTLLVQGCQSQYTLASYVETARLRPPCNHSSDTPRSRSAINCSAQRCAGQEAVGCVLHRDQVSTIQRWVNDC